MDNLGKYLREEREKRGLSLHEVAMSLKINVKILTAIEEGNKDSLPAKTFLRGFVKSYAQFLKLDVDHVLDLFAQEMNEVPTQTSIEPPSAHAPDLKNTVSMPKLLVGSATAIILLLLLFFAYQTMNKYKQEAIVPEVVKVEGPLDNEPPILDSDSSKDDEGSTSTSSTLVVSSTTLLQDPIATITTLKAPTTSSSSTSTTSTSSSTLTSTSTTKTSTSTTSSTQKTTSTTLENKTAQYQVILEAKATVGLKFALDTDPEKSLSMSAGDVHILKARTQLNLVLSEGGKVNIIVNGKDRGAPGESNKEYRLKLPR